MSEQKDLLIVPPMTDYPQPIAAALWRMIDSRERTLEAVKDLSQEALDFQAAGLQNTIGTLLNHIADVEIGWLYVEVLLKEELPPEIEALLPYPSRDERGYLYPVLNVSLSDHLARLEKTRAHFLEQFKAITLEDFYRLRDLPEYDVTPEWVLHHLAQHEDEHRGELYTVKTLYNAVHPK